MSNIIDLDVEGRSSDRFKALHYDALPLRDLTASLGTSSQWLGSAVSHLKVKMGCGDPGGTVEVSLSALALLMQRWEEIEHDGEPWLPNA